MCEFPVRDPVAALTAVAQRLLAERPGPLSAEPPPVTVEERLNPPVLRLTQEMIEIRRAIDLIELEFSYRAAEFATTNFDEQCGSTTHTDWMRHNCQMTGHAASLALSIGQQMPKLEKTVEAMKNGEIGRAHLAIVARTATSLAHRGDDTAFDESMLLENAKLQSPGRFRFTCEHYKHSVDQESFLDDHLTAVERRRLEISSCEDGSMSIKVLLDSVGGATVRSALEPLARRNGVGDTRRRERRLADALIELAEHGLDAGTLPLAHLQRPHLQVSASLETLQGLRGSGAADMEYSTPVPAATVQRLACDSSVNRLLFNAKSELVDIGRKQRVANPAIRRSLVWRDQGCVWPGCDRPPSWTAAHHIRHWAHGGATDLANLVLLCHRHHQMVHEDGWQIARSEKSEKGAITVSRPNLTASRPDTFRSNIRAPAA